MGELLCEDGILILVDSYEEDIFIQFGGAGEHDGCGARFNSVTNRYDSTCRTLA